MFRLYCVMRDEGGGKFNKEADLDVAGDCDTASRKIKQSHYDLAMLDIMGSTD